MNKAMAGTRVTDARSSCSRHTFQLPTVRGTLRLRSTSTRIPNFKSLVAVCVAVAALAALPAAAQAKYRPVVGVGDNSPHIFLDANFRQLGTTVSRKIIPWDFYGSAAEVASLDQWIANAAAIGVEPLIALERSHVNIRRLPTMAEYRTAVEYLRVHYPSVTSISPWNEANHQSQPTAKKPERAAQYYNVVLAMCPYCRIVAADVLDQRGFVSWLKTFKRYAKGKPRLWGLHSYADSNRNATWNKSAAKKMLAAVPGKIWLTEVGGIVAFARSFPYNEQRAAKAVRRTLDLASNSKRIQRVYLYSWFGALLPGARPPHQWDSGIVGPNGVPRPSYTALKTWLRK